MRLKTAVTEYLDSLGFDTESQAFNLADVVMPVLSLPGDAPFSRARVGGYVGLFDGVAGAGGVGTFSGWRFTVDPKAFPSGLWLKSFYHGGGSRMLMNISINGNPGVVGLGAVGGIQLPSSPAIAAGFMFGGPGLALPTVNNVSVTGLTGLTLPGPGTGFPVTMVDPLWVPPGWIAEAMLVTANTAIQWSFVMEVPWSTHAL